MQRVCATNAAVQYPQSKSLCTGWVASHLLTYEVQEYLSISLAAPHQAGLSQLFAAEFDMVQVYTGIISP